MTDAIEIPPCIFCGHRASITGQAGSTDAYVYCLDNECIGVGPTRPTPEEAVAAYLAPIAKAKLEAAALSRKAVCVEATRNLRSTAEDAFDIKEKRALLEAARHLAELAYIPASNLREGPPPLPRPKK